MSEVQSVQWFPGHMAKTRRAIQSSLKLVDIVAELIDARIPVSSRNPVLKSIIGNKPKIVLLNKSDMADPARTAEWVDYFKQHKTVAIPIDCKTGKGLNRLLPEIKNILREQIAADNAMEVCYFNLEEYMKGGGLLSCLVLHVNYERMLTKLI